MWTLKKLCLMVYDDKIPPLYNPPPPTPHHFSVVTFLARFSPYLPRTTDRIGSIHNMGALSLNTSSLKSQLKRECSAWKSKYCQNLHRQAKDNLESLTEYMRVRDTETEREDP